jgi:hypothetical protein
MRAIKLFAIALLISAVAMAQQPGATLKNEDVVNMVESGLQESVVIAAVHANPENFDLSANGLIALKKAGVSDAVIQAMLASRNSQPAVASRTTEPTAARTRSQGMAGVNPSAMMGMISPQALAYLTPAMRQQLMSQYGMGSTDPVAATAPLPKVILLDGNTLQPSIAQVAQSKTKMGGSGAGGTMLQSFATQALSFAAIGGGGMFAGPALGLASGVMGGLPGLGHHPSGPTATYVYGLPGRRSALVLPAGSQV